MSARYGILARACEGGFEAEVVDVARHLAPRSKVRRRTKPLAVAAALVDACVAREDAVELAAACPGCGDAGPHDHNRARSAGRLSFCCSGCGEHFDALPDPGLALSEAS